MSILRRVCARLSAAAALVTVSMVAMPVSALTLDEAIAIAPDNDPWLSGSEMREASMRARGIAAGSLPDPMVSVAGSS